MGALISLLSFSRSVGALYESSKPWPASSAAELISATCASQNQGGLSGIPALVRSMSGMTVVILSWCVRFTIAASSADDCPRSRVSVRQLTFFGTNCIATVHNRAI
jgi:hypothetical protein